MIYSNSKQYVKKKQSLIKHKGETIQRRVGLIMAICILSITIYTSIILVIGILLLEASIGDFLYGIFCCFVLIIIGLFFYIKSSIVFKQYFIYNYKRKVFFNYTVKSVGYNIKSSGFLSKSYEHQKLYNSDTHSIESIKSWHIVKLNEQYDKMYKDIKSNKKFYSFFEPRYILSLRYPVKCKMRGISYFAYFTLEEGEGEVIFPVLLSKNLSELTEEFMEILDNLPRTISGENLALL